MVTNQSSALESNTLQPSQSQSIHNDINVMAHNLPWGLISILAIMLVIGLVIFKRKTPLLRGSSENLSNNIKVKLTKITNNKELQATLNNHAKNITPKDDDPNQINNNNFRMADGIESRYFLLQAKGIFLHLNQLNTLTNEIEINKYLAPELNLDLTSTLKSANLDSKDISCQLIDSKLQTNNSLIATVKFTTNTSVNPGTDSSGAVNQTWNFIKPTPSMSSKWLVAAIQ